MVRRGVGALLLLLGLLAAVGALMLHQADDARAHLQLARAAVSRLEARLQGGDSTDAPALLSRIRSETSKANHDTDGPQWSLAAHLPGRIGHTAALTRGLTGTLDDIARLGLPGLVSAAEKLRPSTLVSEHHVDLGRFKRLRLP